MFDAVSGSDPVPPAWVKQHPFNGLWCFPGLIAGKPANRRYRPRDEPSRGWIVRTHVEFSSDAFPAAPGEEEMVNRGRWGRKLAEYLRRELDRAGLRPGEIRAEDWGWVVPIENEGFPLWVGCGNYDARSDGFLCFVEPSTPFVRKLFRKVETKSRVSRVAEVLDEILVSHSGVWDLRWW